MKNLLLAILLLLLFCPTTYANVVDETGKAITLTQTTDGYMAFSDKLNANIDILKKHTVIVKQREYQASGTIKYYHAAGIAIDKRHILTVNHIVYSEMKSDNYYFSAEGSTPYMATTVKTDPLHDLALLEIDKNAPDLIAAPIPFASGITEVEPIYTIGHPNKYYELTKGTIDVKSKGWNDIEGIALNATIQEGNSGGFVINPQGELVGMVFCGAKMIKSIGYMIGKDDIQNFLK